MNKIIIAIILALAIVGVGFLIINRNTPINEENNPPTVPGENNITPQQPVSQPGIKIEDENEQEFEDVGQPQPTPQPTPAPTPTPSVKKYTLTEIAIHNNSASCWSTINSKVYDLTNWINSHPGGPDKIISICGKDGSQFFNAQHSGQAKPANALGGFYIGDLAQ